MNIHEWYAWQLELAEQKKQVNKSKTQPVHKILPPEPADPGRAPRAARRRLMRANLRDKPADVPRAEWRRRVRDRWSGDHYRRLRA